MEKMILIGGGEGAERKGVVIMSKNGELGVVIVRGILKGLSGIIKLLNLNCQQKYEPPFFAYIRGIDPSSEK